MTDGKQRSFNVDIDQGVPGTKLFRLEVRRKRSGLAVGPSNYKRVRRF